MQLGLLSAVKRPVGWEKKRRLRSKDVVYKGRIEVNVLGELRYIISDVYSCLGHP